VLIALLATGALLLRRQGERALERKLAELRAQGEKLTVRELFGAPTAEDKQRHAQFTAVLGQLPSAPSWVSTADRMKFLEPGRARLLWKPDPGVPDGTRTDTFLAAWDTAAQDIAGVQMVLDQLRAELTDPPRTAGGDYSVDPNTTLKPDYVRLRTASQWLSGAVTLAMHKEDTQGALTNLTAFLNLSQAYRDDPTLVAHMVRSAIAGMGVAAAWDALQSGNWTEQRLAALQSSVQRAEATADLARAFECERAWVFSLGNNARTNPSPGPATAVGFGVPKTIVPVFNAAWRGALAPRDLCVYLDRMQPYVDAARAIRDGMRWSDVKAMSSPTNEPQTTLAEWQHTYLTPFSAAAVPRMDKALLTIARNETLRQMTLAAIAIRRHELRHGQPPPSLEALVPALLPKLPHDSFSGQPLRYRRTDDGGILLYSVGADGKDDGGDTTPTTRAASWTIWDSPDAVWPKPLER
jgi:hypothetical protein